MYVLLYESILSDRKQKEDGMTNLELVDEPPQSPEPHLPKN